MKRSEVQVLSHPPENMQFILGPLLTVLGIVMMRYTVQITNFTGKIDWAEKYFGGGVLAGTYSMWRLVGLGITILGALWFFGLISVLGGFLASVLPGTH